MLNATIYYHYCLVNSCQAALHYWLVMGKIFMSTGINQLFNQFFSCQYQFCKFTLIRSGKKFDSKHSFRTMQLTFIIINSKVEKVAHRKKKINKFIFGICLLLKNLMKPIKKLHQKKKSPAHHPVGFDASAYIRYLR